MVLRIVTLLFAIAFIGSGIAWYMPEFNQNGLLLGLYEVDSMHNMVHIVSGVIALLATFRASLSKTFLLVFGLIYLIVAGAGFFLNGDLQITHVNAADNVLHVAIGVIALFFGSQFKAYDE